jgi:hypothetical protein
MKIYNYNPDTCEFVSESVASENPRVKGEYLIPAYATTIAPLEAGDNETAIYNNGEWSVVADCRGQTYWTDYQTGVEITELGVTLPVGASWEQPEKPAEVMAEEERIARIAEIDALLAQNELACIRPLRAIAAGNGTEFDTQKLAELDVEAEALRAERATLATE